MNIPSQYAEFIQLQYIICLAHHKARVLRIENNVLEELPEICTEDTEYHYSDNEGSGASTGARSATGADSHNKEHYERVFLNHFVKELQTMENKASFEKLFLFVPDDIKNMTFEKIPHPIQEKTILFPGNFYKEQPLELIKKILA